MQATTSSPHRVTVRSHAGLDPVAPSPRLLVPGGYKHRVRAQFDRRSAVYDLNNDYHRPLAEALVGAARLRVGESVLDAATGTGLVALLAAELVGPGGRVLGVDLSQPMLDRASEKAQLAGASNAAFACADLDEIDFPPASFDAVLCSSALVFMPDVPATLGRWRRWLRPGGGRVAFNAPKGQATEAYRLYADLARRYGAPEMEDPSALFASVEAAVGLLEGAGFEAVEVSESVEGRTHPGKTPEKYAESMWAVCCDSPFAPAANLLPPESVEALKRDFLQAAAELGQRFMRPDGMVCEPHTMLRVLGRC